MKLELCPSIRTWTLSPPTTYDWDLAVDIKPICLHYCTSADPTSRRDMVSSASSQPVWRRAAKAFLGARTQVKKRSPRGPQASGHRNQATGDDFQGYCSRPSGRIGADTEGRRTEEESGNVKPSSCEKDKTGWRINSDYENYKWYIYF